MSDYTKPFPKRSDRFDHENSVADERRFKEMFAATFLATWAANNYTDACMNGLQETLETPPVEDAQFLANAAWDHWVQRNH